MSWNSIYINCGDVRLRNYGNSIRFFIIEGIFAGYAFWHPAKLVKEPCGGLYEIVYNDEKWSFVLKKTEKEGDTWKTVDEMELTPGEFYSIFHSELMHIPEPLEPLENVEPLPELIDVD